MWSQSAAKETLGEYNTQVSEVEHATGATLYARRVSLQATLDTVRDDVVGASI